MSQHITYFARASSRRSSTAMVCTWFLNSVHNVNYTTAATSFSDQPAEKTTKGKWLTLPPFTSTIDPNSVAKQLSKNPTTTTTTTTTPNTALKWVIRCCPQLPRSLVQKLFRLRQVRRATICESDLGTKPQDQRLKRVSAKDEMSLGDRIFLPSSVEEKQEHKDTKKQDCTQDEIDYIRSLELYKDPAIIVINKPPGMAVQGGIGIKNSLDVLAAASLKYDYSEPPRLVHRLDRDSSGILVLGRTQTSATVLHSIFREKTFEASVDDADKTKRNLQRTYWALVIGSPRRKTGFVSAPLGKVILDNGKSERITTVDDAQSMSSQHAVTEYRVIASNHGYTWLELRPLTGRKHQLRVHCAEVLGTPIVGDFKYGWQAHRKWKLEPLPCLGEAEKPTGSKTLPFGLNLESGSILEKHPQLHLHCKRMVLPDVSLALQYMQTSSDHDLSQLQRLDLVAPLPLHMQRSWDVLSS